MGEYLAILDYILPQQLAAMPMFLFPPLPGLIPDNLGSMLCFSEILTTVAAVERYPLTGLDFIQIGQGGNKNCFGIFGHDI